MSYEISVGPAQLTVNLGECVLITESNGQIRQPSERGLFYRDTRLISHWTVTGNGKPWQIVNSAATDHFAAQIVLTNPAWPTDGDGEVPAGSVSLTIGRLLGLTGMRETLTVRNHNRTAVRLSLEIDVACDFGDIFDVKGHRPISRGETVTTWSAESGRIETIHSNATFRRGISIAPGDGAPKPVLRDGTLAFVADIGTQESWSTDLHYQVIEGDKVLGAPSGTFADREDCEQSRARQRWRDEAVHLTTPHTGLRQFYQQSLDDLAGLRLPIDGADGSDLKSFVPAAGIPWFAALFGRDSLITAIQTVPVYPDFARGALSVLARYQADGIDDSRDMQPGKIPHELRRGELAELGLVPYRPYYGSADATPLYLILLHHAWRFTNDRGLLETHIATAERCLAWIDQYGDMDGDGFQEYQRRTPDGAENQGWKDSGNGVLYENGDDVPAPKATCELQGYVFDAWRRMAAIYDALGKPDRAVHLRDKAKRMYEQFNAVFWDDDLKYYAFCLDPAKRRVMSIASNPGHLLWSGIVPPDRAAHVVHRLMADDMWSGWGVRTLSASHAAYNPHDYQLGAVWPHDNGLIAVGFKQYGFHDEACRIAGGLVDASVRFELNRLPEVFAGTSRDDSPFPVQYLGANVPQAWAAGSVFSLLHALLGIQIDVAASVVHIDPTLPDWLPELQIEGLHIGGRRIDVRFWRDGAATRAEIVRGAGATLVFRPLGQAVALGLPVRPL